MEIRLRDGETVTRQIDQVKWSPQRPATWEQLVEKFRSMAEPIIGGDSTAEAVERLGRLDELDDLSGLLKLLRRSPPQ